MTFFYVISFLNQFLPAIPVVVAFFLVRHGGSRRHLYRAGILTFVTYFVVYVAVAQAMFGSFNLLLIPGMVVNLFSSIVLPLAWAILSVLWVYLFDKYAPSPAQRRA